MIRTAITLAIPALLLAACGGEQGQDQAQQEGNSGPVTEAPAVPLVDASGQVIGEVRGGDSADGAVLLVEASGLPQGVHGIHIHETGRCEPPKFESAGAHWNPTNAEHGLENPNGPHAGDLANINVGADGRVSQRIVIPGTYLISAAEGTQRQILDADGAALVIHAKADDGRTQPSGASGDRIACAVLGTGVGVGAPGGAATEPPADMNAAAPADANAAGPADANAAGNASY